MTELKQYLRTQDQLYLPYVAGKFGLSLKELCRVVQDQWDKFRSPQMIDDMLHTNYREGRWWYEVCDTKYKRGSFIPADELQDRWLDNQKYDQHISVFAHDDKWVENVRNTGSVSCDQTKVKSQLFWIELDRKDYRKRPHFQQAVRDGQRLRNRILTYDPHAQVWVFTSGNNSTHIAINSGLFGSPIVNQRRVEVFRIMAEMLTKDLRFDGVLKRPARRLGEGELSEAIRKAYPEIQIVQDEPKQEHQFKWGVQIAESAVEDCDTQIYHTNALIRQPWSWHESGKNRKALVNLNGDFKYEPHRLNIKDQSPSLLFVYLEAWKKLKKYNEKKKKKVAVNYDSSYIINQYQKYYPEITEYEPDSDGWVGRFHSYFYDDNNPDVSININTGYHQDFGSPRFSMDFEEFLIKTHKRYD